MVRKKYNFKYFTFFVLELLLANLHKNRFVNCTWFDPRRKGKLLLKLFGDEGRSSLRFGLVFPHHDEDVTLSFDR